MSNTPQGQKPQEQKSGYTNQPSADKVGNNIRKDEPTANTGKEGMKNEGGGYTSGNKTSKI